MNAIHVLLCGTDVFAAEEALRGSVEVTHPAWHKRYAFSCTTALDMERADRRLLLVCHAVVLCRGARPPPSLDYYEKKPVLALDTITAESLGELQGSDLYYGACPLDALRARLAAVSLAPPHVLWEAARERLTTLGERALRRAFWILDKDADGLLDGDEWAAWRRQVGAPSMETSGEEVDPTTRLPPRRTTPEEFLDLHRRWLAEGRAMEAWATLHVVGTNVDGLPYTWYDLHALRVGPEMNTYLSPQGIQFFRSLYTLKRFRTASEMWDFTPGCPWDGIEGFRHDHVPLDRFIEYWKYLALERREVVGQYARYWGYKGEVSYLFVTRRARPARVREEPLPHTIQVLVAGPPRCGRRSLMTALTADPAEPPPRSTRSELFVRTTTFYVRKGPQAEEPQTIIYTTVGLDKAALVLENATLNKTFDVVLLCCDVGDAHHGAEHLLRLHQRLLATRAEGRGTTIPCVLVMTKVDQVAGASAAAVRQSLAPLERYCKDHQLLWPPVSTSARHPAEGETLALNEYVYAVASDPDIALGAPPLTPVRLLRRATLVAMVVVAVAGVGQTLVALLRRRRVAAGG